MSPREREPFRAMLARVSEHGRAPGGVFHIGSEQRPWILRASLMNDDAVSTYMLQLVPVGGAAAMIEAPAERLDLENLFQSLPDSLIVLDRDGLIHQANPAFLDLVQVGDEDAVLGGSLDRWLSRPGADTGALLAKLNHNGHVKLLDATIKGELGLSVDVEVSAARYSSGEMGFVGVILRRVGRKIGSSTPDATTPALPALSTSVGKTPLRQLVQSAVSVVERHYVETALRMTEGNRTAAAELLGLSRQSLYAKLNRYGFESGS
jgi:transcriptional regulator PpsR